MTRQTHTQRGRIQITGFDPDVVERRDPLSDWAPDTGAETESRWMRAFHRFTRNRSALVGVAIVGLLSLLAIFARPIVLFGIPVQPFALAPYEAGTTLYLSVDPSVRAYDPPSSDYWFGVDGNGRDMFSRVIYGGRYSISIGFVVVALTMVFGMIYGSISGYYGGLVDEVMMRIVDTLYAFPGLVLAAIIVTLFGGGYWQLVAAFSLAGWIGYARIMRGEVLKIKEMEYVQAARALGARDRSIVLRHVTPNAMSAVIVVATLNIGTVVIGVAALGFLGLGMPPGSAEWGTMLDQTRETLIQGPGGQIPWHATIFPGGAIFLFVMSMNMIGDGINDALDAQESGVSQGGAQ
ncbi:ABC transporter permease [Natronobeatus ordinarius]|uniref:ABC transporter permease n=1 Tax=Natronobeatus ordinarius TaxID=2963433 RepID=UPI0020CFCF07|nr:ABC transporter permease [Natronobeatus ordinarius]